MQPPAASRSLERVLFVPALILGLDLGLGACSPTVPGRPALEVLDFRQHQADGVFLNETLVLHLSDDLDRTSVSRETVRILGPEGRAAAGRLEVEGAKILFRPHLPRAPRLLDGGLLPGRTYTVELLGFPLPDGIRSRDGVPLSATWRSTFRTVGWDGDPETAVFDEPALVGAPQLALERVEIGPVDPILLVCEHALDPRSVRAEDFWLVGDVESGYLPLRARLLDNRSDGARIELRPRGAEAGLLRALEPGEYRLGLHVDTAPRTLGGVPVRPRWSAVAPVLGAYFRVRQPRVVLRREDFQGDEHRSPAPVPGTEGTAAWSDTGVVGVRYPAAAGSGRDGPVELGDEEQRRDVQATRLHVPADVECELTGDGLVVLRAQGSLMIDGVLRRRGGAEEDEMRFGKGETLSAWLEAARERDPAWTVLIAGGDIVVSGSLETEGPLLLVAGGWVRVSGAVRAESIWHTPGGGGNFRPWPRVLVLDRGPRDAQEAGNYEYMGFVLDPPKTNPLVEPLVFGIQSSPVRPPRGVTSWRPATYDGRRGAGRFRVRFVGEKDVGPRSVEEFGPVDDVLLLKDCEAIRFQIELFLEPGEGRWDPPEVDYVQLSWDEPLLQPGSTSRR
ncbi:MAG: hypothetical protein O7B99_11245 [Planctomycetota bacterium]|nr:hypothetical protein [Planctomycetota bacterium]